MSFTQSGTLARHNRAIHPKKKQEVEQDTAALQATGREDKPTSTPSGSGEAKLDGEQTRQASDATKTLSKQLA